MSEIRCGVTYAEFVFQRLTLPKKRLVYRISTQNVLGSIDIACVPSLVLYDSCIGLSTTFQVYTVQA